MGRVMEIVGKEYRERKSGVKKGRKEVDVDVDNVLGQLDGLKI